MNSDVARARLLGDMYRLDVIGQLKSKQYRPVGYLTSGFLQQYGPGVQTSLCDYWKLRNLVCVLDPKRGVGKRLGEDGSLMRYASSIKHKPMR